MLAAVSGAAGDTGRFPEFNEIPTELLFPKNAQISVDRHGNLLFNGAPRHLIGTEIGLQQLAADLRPSAGYDRKLYRWLYEETLNYENSQRLGLLARVEHLMSDTNETSFWRELRQPDRPLPSQP